MNKSFIHGIRQFNRFYTNILGLLDQHMLNSEFSLSEARVLYEIQHKENCTAKILIEELSVDPGYLSRIIKRFEKDDLTYRVQSKEDGRLYYLYLTDKGNITLSKLDELSDAQIYEMIDQLPEEAKKTLVTSMEIIETTLSAKPMSTKDRITIRCQLKPGDIGSLIHLHGFIYAKECGYNHIFEGYVCKTFYDFLENYSPNKDRFWFAEVDGQIVGAIAIVEHSVKKAQLRWFILQPEFRGIGLGNTLLKKAMNYCKEKAYETVFLETTEDQKAAISMYTKAGFIKIAEHRNKSWGKDLIEQTYELK